MNQLTHDYEQYKKQVHDKGWSDKLVKLDNQVNDLCEFVKISEISKDRHCEFIQFTIPEEKILSVNSSSEHKWYLNIYDENKKEIPSDTKIVITKHKNSENMIQLANISYVDIKNGYIFDSPFKILDNYHIDININSKFDIPKENIKFEFVFDYWTKSQN